MCICAFHLGRRKQDCEGSDNAVGHQCCVVVLMQERSSWSSARHWRLSEAPCPLYLLRTHKTIGMAEPAPSMWQEHHCSWDLPYSTHQCCWPILRLACCTDSALQEGERNIAPEVQKYSVNQQHKLKFCPMQSGASKLPCLRNTLQLAARCTWGPAAAATVSAHTFCHASVTACRPNRWACLCTTPVPHPAASCIWDLLTR